MSPDVGARDTRRSRRVSEGVMMRAWAGKACHSCQLRASHTGPVWPLRAVWDAEGQATNRWRGARRRSGAMAP